MTLQKETLRCTYTSKGFSHPDYIIFLGAIVNIRASHIKSS